MNAQKCLFNGSNPGLGFKVAEDKTFYVDENEAAVVREIFRRYAAGETVYRTNVRLSKVKIYFNFFILNFPKNFSKI